MKGVPGEGQMGFSNKELWPQEEQETTPQVADAATLDERLELEEKPEAPLEGAEEAELVEELTEDQKELAENLFWEITTATIKDPFSNQEIKIGNFLDREFKDGWYAIYAINHSRDHMASIAQLVMARAGTPDRLKMLAEAYHNSPQVAKIQEKFDAKSKEIDDIEETRFDPAAAALVEKLKKELQDIQAELKQLQRIHNEIYHWLMDASRHWQERFEKHGF